MRTLAVAAALLVPALLAAPASATIYRFQAVLNGANERPTPVASNGVAACRITLDTGPADDQANTTINCDFQGLTSTANNAHIHGPADVNTAVGVMLPMTFTTAQAGTAQASGVPARAGFTTAQLVDALRTGQAYVNIHSVNFPAGEIRGQVTAVAAVPAGSPFTVAAFALALGAAGAFLIGRGRRGRRRFWT